MAALGCSLVWKQELIFIARGNPEQWTSNFHQYHFNLNQASICSLQGLRWSDSGTAQTTVAVRAEISRNWYRRNHQKIPYLECSQSENVDCFEHGVYESFAWSLAGITPALIKMKQGLQEMYRLQPQTSKSQMPSRKVPRKRACGTAGHHQAPGWWWWWS